MSTQRKSFALEANGSERLTLTWEAGWNSNYIKNTEVWLDGKRIGVIPTKEELTAGQTFHLADGSELLIQFAQSRKLIGWNILLNGCPISGSASDPLAKLKKAYQAIYLVAGINLVVGLISVFAGMGNSALGGRSIGVSSAVYGLIFLLLGLFVQRRSLVALILAIVLHSFDIVTILLVAFSYGMQPALLIGVLIKGILLINMIKGVQAISSLKKASPPQIPQPYQA